jgi:hypothetical protein
VRSFAPSPPPRLRVALLGLALFTASACGETDPASPADAAPASGGQSADARPATGDAAGGSALGGTPAPDLGPAGPDAAPDAAGAGDVPEECIAAQSGHIEPSPAVVQLGVTGYRSSGDRPEGELRVDLEGARPGRVVVRPSAEPMPVAGGLDAVFTPVEGPATTLALRSRYVPAPGGERGEVLGFSERTFSQDATHWLRIETTFQPDGTAATVRLILPAGEGEVPAPGVLRETASERTWSLLLAADESIARGDPWLNAAGVGALATDGRLLGAVLIDPALYDGAFEAQNACEAALKAGQGRRPADGAGAGGAQKDLNQYVGDCVGATNGCRQDILHCFQNAPPDTDDGLLSPRAAQCTPTSAACATFFVTCGCKDTYEGFTRACNAECGVDPCADTCRCGGGCSQDGTCTCFDEVCCRDFICGCDRGEDFWGRPACAVGDPHVTTHDGTYFDYQGVGEYVLVVADGLTIQGRTRPGETCGGFAYNERLAVGVNGVRVEIDDTGAWLDGEPLPARLVPLPGFVVDAQEGLTRVETEAGDLIVARRIGDWLDVAVRLDPRRRGLVSGLLGDFDDDPANDLRGRGGEESGEALTRAFVEGVMAGSWRVMDGESLFTYGEGESTASHTDLGYPRAPLDPARLEPEARARGEAVCDAQGPLTPELRASCIVDVACTGQDAAAAGFSELAPERAPAISDAEVALFDDDGTFVVVENGPAGEPEVQGCADGQREGLIDAAQYPEIAGCLGTWPGAHSLREPRAGGPCGDDLGACTAPADLCAPGWRICGATGEIADVSRLSAQACREAGGATYAAALSHCATDAGCEYDPLTYPCLDAGWCSEAVCCGAGCTGQGACPDGIWPGETRIVTHTGASCGQAESRRTGGVLCCRE